MQIIAINKKHQSKVNKASKWILKYNALNDLRDKADNNGDILQVRRLNRKCAGAFDSYLDIVNELPLREKAQIDKIFYFN
jgi:hypothetical protein